MSRIARRFLAPTVRGGRRQKQSLAEAVALILDDRREEGLRGVPEDAVKDVVSLG
jgi:hypothetical protein